MSGSTLRGNLPVAQVAENLAFLMPVGELPPGTVEAWARVVEVPWRGPDGSRGRVFVCLDLGVAQAVAGNLLGRMPGEPVEDAEIDETSRELANVISGNLLPALYGTDHEFHLDPPLVVPPVDPGGRREAALQFIEGQLVVAIDAEADNSRILRSAAGR
jgi:hypothetical protein